MTALTRTILATAAIAASLALAGCSAASPATPPAAAQGSDAPTATLEPVEAYLASAENDWRNATRAHFAANQDKIARCMKKAGFEYTPSTLPPAPAPVNQNTEAWVAKHGYGMSAADQKDSERRDIILNTPYGIDAPAQTKYLSHLSKAERTAYDTALLGKESDQSLDKGAGCNTGQPIDPRFTPAATKLAQDSFSYQGAASSDPATVKAQDDWAKCMVNDGHPGLSTPDDAYSKISDLYTSGAGSKQRADKGQPALDPTQLAAARKAEVAMALDDYDCKVKTHYIARTTAVLYKLENAWIGTHKAELDDVIAGYREASK